MISKSTLKKIETIYFSEIYYQRGLRFCILNNLKRANFWLNMAASLGHVEALEMIDELIKKRIINAQDLG